MTTSSPQIYCPRTSSSSNSTLVSKAAGLIPSWSVAYGNGFGYFGYRSQGRGQWRLARDDIRSPRIMLRTNDQQSDRHDRTFIVCRVVLRHKEALHSSGKSDHSLLSHSASTLSNPTLAMSMPTGHGACMFAAPLTWVFAGGVQARRTWMPCRVFWCGGYRCDVWRVIWLSDWSESLKPARRMGNVRVR